MLICPICQSPLNLTDKTWFCDGSLNIKGTKHPFDVARQGYVNLLPVQSKKSKNPGDSQESILARKRFLQAGFYQPLQTSLTQLIQQYVSKPQSWLDIGCGEGYYSQKIAETLASLARQQEQPKPTCLAIDISKPAVIELAKTAKSKQQLWSQDGAVLPVVASASQLPLADNSVQGISSIFSPILPDELARVLVDEGVLLIAKPEQGHLASMRQALFDDVREHNSDKFLELLSGVGFHLLHTETVSAKFCLNQEQLADLLTMTPYSYRAKREKRDALLTHATEHGLETQAKFIIYVLKKTSQI